MSELGQNLKDLLMKGIDAIGNTASSLASSTRQKVNEMALRGKRNEILEAFGEKVYEAWKNGIELPEELTRDLREVAALDEELDGLKSCSDEEDAVAGQDTAEPEMMYETEESEASGEAHNPEESGIPVIDVPRDEEPVKENTPLSDAIDNLFGNAPELDEMTDKINSSLDEMGKQLVQFSTDFGKQLSDMADDLMGKNDKNE